MTIALVTFSQPGSRLAVRLAESIPDSRVYLHADVAAPCDAERFARIGALLPALLTTHRGVIFIAPAGLAIRAIAPHLTHKTTDPAVVVVDVGGRWAVSLLGGHEGGANDLAMRVANILDAEPVITTTSEAARDLIVGIGCRRGTAAAAIVEAIRASLMRADCGVERVRMLASADLKATEAGLIAAAEQLGLPLRLIPSDSIRRCRREFARSATALRHVGVPAVAEPAALLAGRRTRFLLRRQVFPGITVAIAAEDCSSLA